MFNLKYLKHWLITAFAIETFCITYGLRFPPLIPAFSIIYFVAGIGIAVLLLYFPDAKLLPRQKLNLHSSLFYYKSAFLIVLAVIISYLSKYWLDAVAIDIHNADMLPVINVMNKRFVSGQWKHVYDTIPEIWDGIRPIYLPAMWMPFSVSVIFNFDIRWVTAGCLLFVFSVYFFILRPGNNRFFSFCTSIIAFMLFWWLMTENDLHGFISVSEEGVVAVYYVMLVLALLSENIFFTGVATSLCMLSRYALIGWIPAFLLYLLFHRKKLFIFIITGLIFFFGLFILPFGLAAFIRAVYLPEKYVEFTKLVWKDSPEVFPGSAGFAKFFGPDRIQLLHLTLIVSTFLAPFLFTLYCFFKRKKHAISNIPLATLKISVVFFYSFIDVPYLYLFYTSSFVSLIIVAFFTRTDHPVLSGIQA